MATDFALSLRRFLTGHLAGLRGYSTNTIVSYRDAFKLLICYFRDQRATPPESCVCIQAKNESIAVRLDLQPRPEHKAFVNLKRLHHRLRSDRRLLPRRVDRQLTVDCPTPWLQPHYRAFIATTSRSAPVPRIGTLPLTVFAACGSPSRDQKPGPSRPTWPSLSGRQVLLFHASACDELTPPIHRAPPGPRAGSSLADSTPPSACRYPGTTHRPRFRCHRNFSRCVSSGSHTFVFPSHT